MSKIAWRLFSFFIVFPCILGLMFLDVYTHLPLTILAMVTSMIGAVEMGSLLKARGFPVNTYLPWFFGMAFPLLGYLENLKVLDSAQSMSLIILLIIFVFIRQIFTNQDEVIQTVLNKVSGNLLILIYPGLFFYFFIRIASFEFSSIHYLLFALMTFGNDAMAWLVGNLWGKKSSKPFVVSPNKSTIGFIGGIFGSLIVAIGGYYFFPWVLGKNILAIVVFGLSVGVLTIIGDLFESSLKRSAKMKDSGNIIPGRGGILDSVDSLLFVAPLWFSFFLYFPK